MELDTNLDSLSSLGLSDRAMEKLRLSVECLREFEAGEKIPTRAGRIKRLRHVEKCALDLRNAIKSLDNGSFLSLEDRLVVSESEVATMLRGAITPKLGGFVDHVDQLTCFLAVAATEEAAELGASGRGGRPEVLPAYAGFVYGIAHDLRSDRIAPGRGGRFQKICEAVFSAAGVHAKPEGAIRYFIDNMLAQGKARGLVYVDAEETSQQKSRKIPPLKAVK